MTKTAVNGRMLRFLLVGLTLNCKNCLTEKKVPT